MGPIATAGRRALSVEIKFTETGGVWRFLGNAKKGKNNPCVNREFPIKVVSHTSSDIVFEVDGESVVSGCINQKVILKSGDGKSLVGELDDGRSLALERQ